MPKRKDMHKISIIGSGLLIIGQTCEFDYSGTLGFKALRSLAYKIMPVGSSVALISDGRFSGASRGTVLEVK